MASMSDEGEASGACGADIAKPCSAHAAGRALHREAIFSAGISRGSWSQLDFFFSWQNVLLPDLWSTMSTADLDALLKLLSDDTKAMEAVGANFQRTFPKSDHFRLAATIWCVPAVACVGGCVGDVGGDGRGRGAAARSKSGQPRSVRTRVRAPVVSVSVAFAVSVTVSVSLSVRVRARRARACACVRAYLCVHAGDG